MKFLKYILKNKFSVKTKKRTSFTFKYILNTF